MIREYFKMDPLIHSGLNWNGDLSKYDRILVKPFMGKFTKPPALIGKNGKPRPVFSPRLKQEVPPAMRVAVSDGQWDSRLQAEVWLRKELIGIRGTRKIIVVDPGRVQEVKKKSVTRKTRKSSWAGIRRVEQGMRQFVLQATLKQTALACLMRIQGKEIWLPKKSFVVTTVGSNKIIEMSTWWADQKNL